MQTGSNVSVANCQVFSGAPSFPHLLHSEGGVDVSVERPVLGQLLLHGLAVLHQFGQLLAHQG